MEEIERIKDIAAEFYKKLLGSTQMVFDEVKAARVPQLITKTIPAEKADLLLREVTAEEIRRTLFDMKSNKAPGPDGFTSEFFKASWSVVGREVVPAMKSFFDLGNLLKEVNATILTLVSKKVNPAAMEDFRPIACCKVLYKCITKILSNPLVAFFGGIG